MRIFVWKPVGIIAKQSKKGILKQSKKVPWSLPQKTGLGLQAGSGATDMQTNVLTVATIFHIRTTWYDV